MSERISSSKVDKVYITFGMLTLEGIPFAKLMTDKQKQAGGKVSCLLVLISNYLNCPVARAENWDGLAVFGDTVDIHFG